MLQSPRSLRESLDELIDSLDAAAHGPSSVGNRRLRLRRSFRTGCEVTCFPIGRAMVTVAGRTRNISFRGLCVLVEATLGVGHPIEVRIDVPSEGPTYLGGTVAFCRRVRRGQYEVGLSICTSAPRPIFKRDPVAAALTQPWLANALAAVEQAQLTFSRT